MRAASFKVYEAKDGFRWRLRGGNGRIIAESGEAYTRHRDCELSVERVIKAAAAAGLSRKMTGTP